MRKVYSKPNMIVTSYVAIDTTTVTLNNSMNITPNQHTANTFKNYKLNS